jgi:hypothetical protein
MISKPKFKPQLDDVENKVVFVWWPREVVYWASYDGRRLKDNRYDGITVKMWLCRAISVRKYCDTSHDTTISGRENWLQLKLYPKKWEHDPAYGAWIAERDRAKYLLSLSHEDTPSHVDAKPNPKGPVPEPAREIDGGGLDLYLR